eukprot:TRINITY_DN63430_c0_g1_i1.p1 TRINITY_DN63430_c0_g1~~TRINITY_DN63430_c0_g1_i1.p1  ORF type:complete len:339 (-),score=59.98 TRINITY_DN63430_c0_g1_i1:47-1063(-)
MQRVVELPVTSLEAALLATKRARKADGAKSVRAQPHLSDFPSIDRCSSRGWVVPSGNGLDEQHNVLLRVRQRLNAAKKKQGLVWEELFTICDEDKSGTLSWKEFLHMVRNILGVACQTVCDRDLKVLYDQVDNATSVGCSDGMVDLGELLQYLARGQQDPELQAARAQQRVARVRRNIVLAFQKLNTTDAAVREMFQRIDVDASNRLSQYEFEMFVREDLELSHWDVLASDLNEFYQHMDKNGDGVDCQEFLDFVREVKSKTMGEFDCHGKANPLGNPKAPWQRASSRARLAETSQGFNGSTSMPQLKAQKPSIAFRSSGRDRRPCSRMAATGSGWFS